MFSLLLKDLNFSLLFTVLYDFSFDGNVIQEVNNFESSVVVQELEFAMNLALYGLL